LYDICGSPWQTPEERYQAQSLVIKLERLKRLAAALGLDGQAAPAKATLATADGLPEPAAEPKQRRKVRA
jgi:hypothetical protein